MSRANNYGFHIKPENVPAGGIHVGICWVSECDQLYLSLKDWRTCPVHRDEEPQRHESYKAFNARREQERLWAEENKRLDGTKLVANAIALLKEDE